MNYLKLTEKLPIVLILILFNCSFSDSTGERDIKIALDSLDKVMKRSQFDYRTVNNILLNISKELINSTDHKSDHSSWQTFINYKWNGDSSVTMIKSIKHYKRGFKKETIIHINDSILFVKRFLVWTQTDTDTSNYTFVENIEYFINKQTIKELARIEFVKKNLADTLKFKQLPFNDVSNEGEDQYDDELEYCSEIEITN